MNSVYGARCENIWRETSVGNDCIKVSINSESEWYLMEDKEKSHAHQQRQAAAEGQSGAGERRAGIWTSSPGVDI
jgi:hypothetical protein